MTLIPPQRLPETVDRFSRYLSRRMEINDPPRRSQPHEMDFVYKMCREEISIIHDAFLKMFDPEPDDRPVVNE